MDIGATICTPKRPACALCPLAEFCRARRHGGPGRLSGKAPKAVRPSRSGAVFLYPPRRRPRPGAHARSPRSSRRHDRIPRHRLDRAKQPSGERHSRHAAAGAPDRLPGRVDHVFTHFALSLCVHVGRGAGRRPPPRRVFRFVSPRALDAEALPSLMRKVVAHVRAFERSAILGRIGSGRLPASPHRHRKRRKTPAPTAPS